MTTEKKKISIYAIVFGGIAVLVVLAALSTFVFNKNLSSSGGSGGELVGSLVSAVNATNYATLSNLQNYGPAPNFEEISAWINSPPLNISSLRGKVVIVDFWTYSCINCIRTIPFLNALESEYGNNGLVIVGVSTPEFPFEMNYSNVYNAVQRFDIKYPVALDNNYGTWDAYGNEYWPADYIIDKNGDVRYLSFGESPDSFNETQQVVREMLRNANYTLPSNVTSVQDALNFSQTISPEMYLGYSEITNEGRTNYFASGEGLALGQNTTYPTQNVTRNDTIYLEGTWYSASDSLIAVNGSKLFIAYRAKDLNVVASGNGGNSTLVLKLDGQNLTQGYLGSDAHLSNGEAIVNVSASRLYNLVSAPGYGWHTLEIEASKGFSIYTFTFG